jgi:GT2 family glycosyltransferase
MSAAPPLAIVIVNFNTKADLARCLESLAAHPPTGPHEIAVVDNASSDGTADYVAERWPTIVLVRNAANVGFARATNQGIRATTAPLALLLNSDTVVPAGALDTLRSALIADASSAIAGPRLVDDHGTAELSFGRMIGPLNELRQKASGRLVAHGPAWVRRRVLARTSRPQHVDWVSGACLMVRRDVAEAVGLLDERYAMYCEDVDFCASVRRWGWTVLYTPAAEVIHLRGRSAAVMPTATSLAYRRSQVAFYEKHHPRWAPLLRLYLSVRGIRYS